MAADEHGNDLEAVGVPIRGLVAFASRAAANVITEADMGDRPLPLPAVAKILGLVKVDGAPQESREGGDRQEFWQKGYSLAGDGSRTVQVNLAEQNDAVLELTEGRAPDANGVIKVSSDLPNNRFILYELIVYKGGMERLRQGVASVTAVEPDQKTRGEVAGVAVTFAWEDDPLFEDSPFWQWGPAVPGAPITPTGVTAGEPGEFLPAGAALPANITALRALGTLGQTTAWTTGQYVILGNSAHVSWDGEDWKTGAAE